MLIIAELGINHNGDMDLARSMIDAAKDCGADAVKFQLYDPRVTLADAPEVIPQVLHTELSQRQWYECSTYAKQIGIDCSASVFDDLERLHWLRNTKPPWYKVGSRAFRDTEYVESVIAIGKPIYISLGLACAKKLRWKDEKGVWRDGYQEGVSIEKDLELMRKYEAAPNVKFMLCVSEYPTAMTTGHKKRWRLLGATRGLFSDKFCGFSDHSGRIEPSLWAIAHGATVIEVHFSLDKSAPGVDQVSSIEPDELRTLCSLAPEIERLASL